MDSPRPRPDAAPRALESRRGLRLFAITLWTSFLGATLTLVFVLNWLPADSDVSLAKLSAGFLGAWALATVPVALALLLAEPRDGR
jgi:hypothetical protein